MSSFRMQRSSLRLPALGLGLVLFGCSAKDKILDHLNAFDFESHVEKYDADGKTLTERAAPTAARIGMPVASGGKIYVIGGIKGSTQYVDNVEIYDPASNTWKNGAAWPNPRVTQFFDINGLICAVAGYRDVTEVSDVECYDTAADKWSKRKPYPTGAAALNAVLSNGKIFVLGSESGKITERTAHAEGFVYDPAADTWSPITNVPNVCTGPALASVDDSAYMIGCPIGEGGDPAKGDRTLLYRYSLAANSWTTMADKLPTPYPGYGQVAVVNKTIVVEMADGNNDVLLFDTVAKTFKKSTAPVDHFVMNQYVSWSFKGAYYRLVNFQQDIGSDGDAGKQNLSSGHVWKYDFTADTWTHAGEHRQDTRTTLMAPLVFADSVFLYTVYSTTDLSIH